MSIIGRLDAGGAAGAAAGAAGAAERFSSAVRFFCASALRVLKIFSACLPRKSPKRKNGAFNASQTETG